MKILLLYGWGNVNAGDAAITPGTVKLLGAAFPGAEVTVVSRFQENDPAFAASAAYLKGVLPDVELLPYDLLSYPSTRPRPVRQAEKLARALLLGMGVMAPVALGAAFSHSRVFARLRSCDLVLVNGGHLLFWNPRMGERRAIVQTLLLPCLLAERLGVPYAFHGQSVGPFEFGPRDAWARWLLRHVLGRSRAVTTRETVSAGWLTELCGDALPVGTVLDSAYFHVDEDPVGASALLARHGLLDQPFVALTPRLSRRGSADDLDPARRDRIATALRTFLARWLAERPEPLAIVCQVPRDADDARRLLDGLPGAEAVRVLQEAVPPETLRALYRRSRLLVGMRFHSLIFALTVGTPCVGGYYYEVGPKIRAMLADLGLADEALDLDEVGGDLLFDRAAALLARREAESRRLLARLDELRQRSVEVTRRLLGPRPEPSR
jgi:colanic acid/amylovoran biosynthesis protein